MTNVVSKIILEKGQCLCRLAVEVGQFAKKIVPIFCYFCNGGGHFWVTFGHGGGVGVEVDLKGQCSCRLDVEVRQFAKKLFRFFVIFLKGGGHFWVTWVRRRGASEKVIEINASTCQM